MNRINISYFNGSNRTNSTTQKIINSILENLQSDLVDNQYIINDLSSTDNVILECTGCLNCFNDGTCYIKDSMDEIKTKLLDSDLIIFGTPVFLNHVTSKMKKFLDRIAYWTHLFRLIDKKCIIIIVTQNSGIDETLSYLYKIFSFLGLDIIGIITIRKNDTVINEEMQLEIIRKKLVRLFRVEYKFIPTNYQENIFKSLKYMYQEKNKMGIINRELSYWIKHKWLFNESLIDAININETLKSNKGG